MHKLQCFCFEELRLCSFDSVDLPVLFYLDTIDSLDLKVSLTYTFLSFF
jgi:cytochrome c oxidase assembly protein Cox11